ncbi:hypothetical protein AG1IA_02135 [Rhizoctonia solani AG-1 IA]|uniref:Uncharacterized protein n=1 Tax=Thanatephorus cucumeris (strain AG1-IA) TaxID=983506 RepID=L8X487_THACA|nr:hypothetical protein AG1IA_02135 [Rhizoctonia solani AG-1 IA]
MIRLLRTVVGAVRHLVTAVRTTRLAIGAGTVLPRQGAIETAHPAGTRSVPPRPLAGDGSVLTSLPIGMTAFSLLRNLDLPGWVATSPLHDWLGAPDQNPYPEL